MKEKERVVATGMTLIFLVTWLGFVFHRSNSFAGSLLGSLIGILGSLLMLVPLAYSVIKRIPSLKKRVTGRVSMRTLLAWHIYAGLLGPLLVLIHSGHKFESPLGALLTAMTIIVVISGFVGRYLMSRLSKDIKHHREQRDLLLKAFESYRGQAAKHPSPVAGAMSGLRLRLMSMFFDDGRTTVDSLKPVLRGTRVAVALAEEEYAIKTRATVKKFFSRWLKLHIVLSCLLYALLLIHVVSGFYFGLRWL